MIRSKFNRTKRLCLAIGVWCCLSCSSWLLADDSSPPTNSGTANTLAEAIAELGSDRFAIRRDATLQIIAHGVEAVGPVAKAARSNDREVRQRAFAILQHFASRGHVSAREAILTLAGDSDPRIAHAAKTAWNVVVQGAIAELKQVGATCDLVDGKPYKVEASRDELTDDQLQPLGLLLTLRELHINGKQITNAGLDHLKDLTKLEYCNLKNTGITDDGLTQVSHLTTMRKFSVEHTKVTDLGLKHLNKYHRLETLYLGGSEVKGPGLESLAELPITYLSLQGCKFNDDATQSIVHLKQLTTLGLDDVSVTDACLPTLLALKDLEVLWLDRSEVTDAAIDDLAQFKKLKKLHLRETRVTKEGVDRLRKRMPGVTVYHSVRGEETP